MAYSDPNSVSSESYSKLAQHDIPFLETMTTNMLFAIKGDLSVGRTVYFGENFTFGDAATDTFTCTGALSTTGDVTFTMATGDAFTLTVTDLSAPVVMTNTVTTAGTTGGRALFHVKTNVAMGGWANGVKGYWEATGTSGRVTGLASGVCAELKTANASLASGAYYPGEFEYVAGGTSTASTGSGSRVGFLYMQHSGDIDGDFDDNGYLFTAAGLTAGAGHLLSANSLTLKVQTGIAGSETTEYVFLSDSEDALTMGVTGTPLSYTAGTPFFGLYATNAGTSGGTNAEPFLVESTLTGAGQVGGRSRFKLTANAAQGGWTNALKAQTVYGASGYTTGMGSALCAELELSAGTTQGTYAPLESEIVVGASGSLGTATSFLYMNVDSTGENTFNTSGYLFELGSNITSASGDMFSTDDAAAATHSLRIRVAGTTYYLMVSDSVTAD